MGSHKHAPLKSARSVITDPEGKFLILTRLETDRYRPGLPDLPGGKVDAQDKTVFAGALRETEEETGLVLDYLVKRYSKQSYYRVCTFDETTGLWYPRYYFSFRLAGHLALDDLVLTEHSQAQLLPKPEAVEALDFPADRNALLAL